MVFSGLHATYDSHAVCCGMRRCNESSTQVCMSCTGNPRVQPRPCCDSRWLSTAAPAKCGTCRAQLAGIAENMQGSVREQGWPPRHHYVLPALPNFLLWAHHISRQAPTCCILAAACVQVGRAWARAWSPYRLYGDSQLTDDFMGGKRCQPH